MEPKSVTSLILPKALLPDPEIVGSMDGGCSLTKFLYKKPIKDNEDQVSLQMAFFKNENFDSALQWLSKKLKAEACPGSKFRVSGVGGEKYHNAVADATGLQVEFIDEFVAHTAGAHLLVKNLNDDEFCYPDFTSKPNVDDKPQVPGWFALIAQHPSQHYQENICKRLPAMYCPCGSGIGFNLLHEDKSFEIFAPLMFGGRSMMGLSQLLLGTNSYEELTELASRGDRRRVDTLAADVMSLGEGAEFSCLPPDTTLFSMGKAADTKSDFSREDLAAAIIGTVLSTMLPLLMSYCKSKRVPTVYFGGNLFQAEIVRRIFHSNLLMSSANAGIFKFRFLSNGHTHLLTHLK